MKFDPRTEKALEEEKDLLVTVNSWEFAGVVCKKLAKEFPAFVFSRTDKIGLYIEICVTPSPTNDAYWTMKGYAKAITNIVAGIIND